MKLSRLLLFVIPFFLISANIDKGSLYSIVTDKEDAMLNKNYRKFYIVDDATGLALGKNPVKFDVNKENIPVNYFTLDIPASVDVPRNFIVHNIIKSDSGDEYDWVLEHNKDENSIFFAKKKFIIQKISMYWIFIVRGERVVMKNVRTGNYLAVKEDGSYVAVDDESKASKWKLIHIL